MLIIQNKIILPICFLLGFFLISCFFEDKSAGGGTVTGNVEGVIFSEQEEILKGVEVSLYKRIGNIASPEDVNEPVGIVETNENGKFSFDVADGEYSVVAVKDGKYAFIDSIKAGKEEAKDLEGILREPGGMKGKIKNTLELQSPGTVVIHLIGTNIYKNVSKDGSFLITDIPAGFYTFVSYSTFQAEFSPKYDTVTIFPDSITDLREYELDYFGIPIPKNVQVCYDTLNQVVMVSWDSITNFEFDAFVIYRGLEDENGRNMKYLGYTKDTLFIDSITIDSSGESFTPYRLDYRVFVVNMTGDTGKYWGTHSAEIVTSDYAIPKINNDIILNYDPLGGLINVSWDSLLEYKDFGGYSVVRVIWHMGFPSNNPKLYFKDTLPVITSNSFQDTIFPNHFSFEREEHLLLQYSVGVFHKNWQVVGKRDSSTIKRILSYKAIRPIANAGPNQTVSPGAYVKLVGIVDSSVFPIIKMEWKIGEDTNWIEADNGVVSLTTPSEYIDTLITGTFRVEDSLGNLDTDEVDIESYPLMLTYNSLPTSSGTISHITNFKDKYWTLLRKEDPLFNFQIFTSNNLNDWKLELEDITFEHEQVLGVSNVENNLFITTTSKNSMGTPTSVVNWKSLDGVNWSKLPETFNDDSIAVQYFYFKGKAIQLFNDIYVPLREPSSISNFKIFKSASGEKWIPQFDIPRSLRDNEDKYSFFVYDNYFCFTIKPSLYCSGNGGVSWEQKNNFWETDLEFQFSPDWVEKSYSIKNSILLQIVERPSLKKELIYFYNNKWINIPTHQINFNNQMFVLDDLILFVDENKKITGLDLPK